MAEIQAPIRLIAIDLDGTLLNDAKEVSLRTAEALWCATARGVRVVIASARPPRSVRHIYRQLRLNTWQINYNGAAIWDEAAGRFVFHKPMDCTLVRAMIDAARGRFPDILVSCEILDRWFTDDFDEAFARRFTTETGRLFRPDVIDHVDHFCTHPITKLLLLGSGDQVRELTNMLRSRFGGQIAAVSSEPELLQVMDRCVNKAAALKVVAGHYGIDMSQVMSIGDAPNDLEMLQASGVSIAMDNAHADVKAIATWIAPSNNDHGVHVALERYGLCD